MEELVNRFHQLRLESLDDSWVEAVFYSEFLEYGEFPAEYSEIIRPQKIRSIFLKLIKAVDKWLNADLETDEEKSWAVLSSQVPHRKLLALIGYFINQGTKNIANEQLRTNALIAARVYIKLLSIPGFLAYAIYHSQLFANSLACVGYPKLLYDKYEEQKTKWSREDRANRDDYIGTVQALTDNVNDILKSLICFVTDLNFMIKPLKLTPTDMNFEDILSNLIDVTGGDIVSKLNVDKILLSQVSHTIYKVIDVLLHHPNDPESADSNAVDIIFKCMLPKIISASVEGNKNSNNNAVASYVTYSGYLLLTYKEPAFNALFVLLQHLCHQLDGLERAEVRNARITVVAGLMTLLPKKLHRKLVSWLIILSDTAKCSHRIIALDLIEKLFTYAPDPRENANKENNDGSNNTDTGAPLQNGETNEQQPDKENGTVNETSEQNNTQQQTDNNIDNEPEDDEEAHGNIENAVLEHQPRATVPYARLLHAVYDRVHDVSAGVRVRALVILANCFENKNPDMKKALKELQGSSPVSRLMAVAARCVCDERAVVRRAAASLAHRLIAAARTPTELDLGILVSLCRDASIIVRSSAIAFISEMLENRPCETLVEAFLLGPIHNLSDPETKVQDQVLTVVRSLVIERITTYNSESDDTFPWRILAAITKHKMKSHLQKACTLLAKNSNAISVWLVDTLSTHLGAVDHERDLLTLVLLTCVARHVEYSDIDFALQYYYRLANSDDTPLMDSRLMPLTLDLLGQWYRFANTEQRTSLRSDLVSRLASSCDDGCRIMRAHLAAQLDPDNLTWASELMQLSERSSLMGADVSEWLRAADLSLVTKEPPSDALLQKFLTSMKNPPKEWSGVELGTCVVGAGRLCLRSRAVAAAAAPAFASLLHTDAPLHPRRNCLLALFDICTRYSCIVEPHLGAISRCVEPQAPGELRRAAARGLTQQLLAGYLRLRPPLYYTYCALLADDDLDVREPAQYYVSCCLTTDAIVQHLVDTIQHYNSDSSDNILSFDSRQLIYDVMLQRLSMVQRLNMQCRLAREILEDAAVHVDYNEELTQTQKNALLDTITLLCGPRMRLPSKKPQASANGDIPDIDELQERVTTNVVSQKMKIMVAEMLVPAVLRLHARLRPGGGQLVTYLVRLANDLLEDYSAEIKGIIEEDEAMMQQIEQFKETTGLEPIKGNSRNLVTSSAPPEPDTPRAPRRRPASFRKSEGVRKRALQI